MATVTIPGAPTNLIAAVDAPIVSSGSLAAGLGTPSFQDLFNYTSSSEAAFTKIWQVSTYESNSYAGAGSNVTFKAANITFPTNPNTSAPCLCLTLNQTSATVSNGAEILSVQTFGYGTYEFFSRIGSSSSTPTGTGSAVSGGVSSTFLISN